jgi:hypothetical protein
MNDLFKQDDFRQQYELAKEQGDKRFGSPCSHTQTSYGVCLNCLRKVVTRPTRSRLSLMDELARDEQNPFGGIQDYY